MDGQREGDERMDKDIKGWADGTHTSENLKTMVHLVRRSGMYQGKRNLLNGLGAAFILI